MSYLILDATYLACPSITELTNDETKRKIRDYLHRLVDLSALKRVCRTTNFVRDESLTRTLHELGLYPFHSSISAALSLCSDEFDVQIEDVRKLLNSLLEKSELLEDIGDITDVAIESFSFFTEETETRQQIFINQLVRTIALAGLGLCKHQTNKNTFLATDLADVGKSELSCTLQLSMAEKSDGSIIEISDVMNVTFPIHRNTASHLIERDFIALLMNLRNIDALIDSCIGIASQSCGDHVEGAIELSDIINFGKDFICSASHLGFLHEPSKVQRLLRVCSDILVGRNLSKSHHLRVGNGGDDMQRTRGVWSAWRHDLDDEFHLHYWRNGNAIEFSNVVVHNDFKITY